MDLKPGMRVSWQSSVILNRGLDRGFLSGVCRVGEGDSKTG